MKLKKTIRMPLRRVPQRMRPPKPAPLRARVATANDDYDEEDYESEEEPNMKLSHAFLVVLILHIIAVGGIFAFNSIKARQTADAKTAAKAAATTAAAREEESADSALAAQAAPVQAEAPVEAAAGKTHTVQAGETLSKIATMHKTSVAQLEKENGITSYTMIRVGQVLRLPSTDKLAATAGPEVDTIPLGDAPATAATRDTAKPAVQQISQRATPAASAKPETATAKAVAPATAKPAASPAKAEAKPAGVDGNVYVVGKGDNPYSIAKKLHVSYNDLIKVNDIKDPTKIQIGQKLKIPAKSN